MSSKASGPVSEGAVSGGPKKSQNGGKQPASGKKNQGEQRTKDAREESKQPAGALPDDQTRLAQRLLVLANNTASFYCVRKSTNAETPYAIEADQKLPIYSDARIARFAPKEGKQAAIAS